MTEITKLKEAIAALDKQYRQSKGYDECAKPGHCELEDTMYRMIQNVYQYIGYLERDFYNYINSHGKGHLPPINGAEKMENALDVLGIGNDYEIYKPAIFASASRKNTVIEVEFSK